VACQNVSAAAHQLGYHGIIAPAATKMGETLALFTDLLTATEQPLLTATEMWVQLPPDPRNPPTAQDFTGSQITHMHLRVALIGTRTAGPNNVFGTHETAGLCALQELSGDVGSDGALHLMLPAALAAWK
jgi:hypothetical protein